MTFLSSCFSNGFVYIFIPFSGTLNSSILSMVVEIQTSAWLQAQVTAQHSCFDLALCPLAVWPPPPLPAGRVTEWKRH